MENKRLHKTRPKGSPDSSDIVGTISCIGDFMQRKLSVMVPKRNKCLTPNYGHYPSQKHQMLKM